MDRTRLIALASLLLVLLFLPGCDNESTTAAPQPADTTSHREVDATHQAAPQPTGQTAIALPSTRQPTASPRAVANADAPLAESAFVVIQNASPTDPQLLVRQLQRVLPASQQVKQVQSPNPQEIKLEVTNTRDLRALANKVPFGSVESVNDQTRTITVDFNL